MGKYKGTPLEERTEQANLLCKRELNKISTFHSKDRFLFARMHPITGNLAKEEPEIMDVVARLQLGQQNEPETAHELYHRIHAELLRIAHEIQALGLREIGISTHGAVLATLINFAQYGDKDCFVPVHYQTTPLYLEGKLVMPVSVKIGNCALAHFRYWHKSQQLQFCGMLN